MDTNIKRLKALLEDGYKVIGTKFTWRNEGQNATENIVTLKKGQNTEVINSVNSPEFTEFMFHFKKAKDKYDNDQFVYVENLNLYNSVMQDHQDQPLLREHHKLRISGLEFNKGVMTLYFKPRVPDNKEGFAYFLIELNENPSFVDVDFRDEIEVCDKSDNVIFRGFVKSYESSGGIGYILAQDMILKLANQKVSVEFNSMNPVDSAGLLAESCGFTFKPSGTTYVTNERDFVIIMPLINLIIDQSFRIGNVDFYQEFSSLDDSFIRKSNTGRKVSLWNGNFPRAKVTVSANRFYEAMMKGFNAISKAVDVITLHTDLSFAAQSKVEDNGNFQFSYYKCLSKVKIPTWIYCREKDSKAHTFFNLESVIENILSLEIDPQMHFKRVCDHFNVLIAKDNPNLKETNILQVLHWLRKSIQEGSNKDKFIDLWIAFEFLLSGEKTEKMFTTAEISYLIVLVDKTQFDSTKKEAIKSKIRMLNEPPLMKRFLDLKKNLNINLSDWELDILRKARKKRTGLIHGKRAVDVSDTELNKMRTIIEKLLIGKLNLS